MEDFELAIKENYLEKEALTDTKEVHESEHDSVMATSEDDDVEANSMETHSEDDNCIITHSEEDEPEIKIKQEIVLPYEDLASDKMEIDECSTAAATRASSECSSEMEVKEEMKQEISDSDSAVGSMNAEDPIYKDGDLVWGGFSHASWWPCIVSSDEKSKQEKGEKKN